MFVIDVQRAVKTKLNVTTQAAVSMQQTISVMATIAVVMVVMNQPTAVSDMVFCCLNIGR